MFKKEEVVHLEAESPQELGKILDYLSDEKDLRQHLASLDIYGQGVLVQQFELPCLKDRELRNALKLEAVELLSFAPEDIDVDYQILTKGEKVSGVFIAASRNILEQYVAFLRKSQLFPLRISALILREVNSFHKKYLQKIKDKNCCLIVNPKDNIVNLAIFSKGNLELLRDVNYISFDEMAHEVMQTIRYYQGKRPDKELDEVYLITTSIDSDRLSKVLELECGNANIIKEQRTEKNQVQPDMHGPELFNINLIRKSSVSLPVRKLVLYGMNAVILIFLFITGIQIYEYRAMNVKITQLKTSYNPADYEYARNLEIKKELLKHGK